MTLEHAIERLLELPERIAKLKAEQLLGQPTRAPQTCAVGGPYPDPEEIRVVALSMRRWQEDQIAIDMLMQEQENLRVMLPVLR